MLYDDFDYFIGSNVLEEWNSANRLTYEARIYPKIPFIIGEKFSVDNLFASEFPQYIIDYVGRRYQAGRLWNTKPHTIVHVNCNRSIYNIRVTLQFQSKLFS